MLASRPSAILHTEDQWRRAAHERTSLQPGTWAVQLAWSHAAPAPALASVGPQPIAGGLAFDPWCRLYHSLPEQGRVERLLTSGEHTDPLDVFASEPLTSPGQFKPATPPAPPLASPRGLCVDDEGRLFVAEHGRGRVLVHDLVDRRLLRAIAVPGRPLDLACDGHDVYVLLDRAPFLVALTARTGPRALQLPPHVVGIPGRVALDASGGLHLLTDAGTLDAKVVSLELRYETLAVPGATDLEFMPVSRGDASAEALVVARTAGVDFLRFSVRASAIDRLPDLKARGYDGRGVVRTPAGELAFWTPKGLRHAVVARVRYAREGRVTCFRLDAGAYQATWGRVFIDACIPPDTSVQIFCVTADEPPADAELPRTPPESTIFAELAHPELSPPMPPLSLVPGPDAQFHRLHRRDSGREPAWSQPADDAYVTYEAPVLAGPGRYLWVFLALAGDSRFTPRVRSVRVEHGAHELLRRLPAVFAREPESADFLRRYLGLFDGFLLDLELRALHRRALLDPQAAPEELLPWLASFVGLVLDERWPTATRRAVIAEALWLFRFRGTVAGLTRFLELYLGRPPIIVERFRLRGTPGLLGEGPAAAVVGTLRVGGPVGEPVLPDSQTADAFTSHAHRFSVIVPMVLSGEQEAVVRHILDVHRPAHTLHELCTASAGMRVGLGLHVALTTIVGRTGGFTRLQVGGSVLGRDAVVGRPGPGTIPGASRLGHDTRIA